MPGGGVAVVGLGVAGEAVVRALASRDLPFVACDDRPTEAHDRLAAEMGFRFEGAPDDAMLRAMLADADEFLPTPGLPERHASFAIAAELGVARISEFDLAARWDSRPLVAVTGTNGKTTVVMMVTEMLNASGRSAAAVGNTDVPLVAALEDGTIEVFVVEASSFRLAASATFRPKVATWLNFAPDHLDVHTDLAVYEASKARIWADQTSDDVAIGNVDDPVVTAHLEMAVARRIGYGLGTDPAGLGGYREIDGRLITDGGDVLVRVDELSRGLPHDRSNALAAAATALEAGADLAAVRDVLRTFRHLAHRVELVSERAGVRWFDDSKATTPEAVLAAMAGFERLVLIAGGKNKGLDLGGLAAGADSVKCVVAIGASAHEISAAFEGIRPVHQADSMNEAVALAASLAEVGDTVLLSPGAASFDWYRNYGERGDDFARLVRELPDVETRQRGSSDR